MNRSAINYVIDSAMVLSFLVVFTTGLLKFPRLLPSLGISYLGLRPGFLSQVHDWAGIFLGLLILLHLVLHCKWLCAMTKRIFRFRK